MAAGPPTTSGPTGRPRARLQARDGPPGRVRPRRLPCFDRVGKIAIILNGRNDSGVPVWKSKFYGAFVLNLRVDLHAIDATPARWRGDAGRVGASIAVITAK